MNLSNRYLRSGSNPEQSWAQIYEALKGKIKDLKPEDLYRLAEAAYLTGKEEEWIDIFGLAHQKFLENDRIGPALRCAFWIGMLLMFKGERARGSGWFSRAQRLVEENHFEGSEKGFQLIPAGLGALGAGNAEKANSCFKKAREACKGNEDPDITTLSLLGQGQAMINLGKVPEGRALLDESMIAVESANVSPLAVGIVYCAVIETCQKIFDVRRAREWTLVLSQWCKSQPDLVPFRGQCLIRRSQVKHLHGEWAVALNEMHSACKILAQPPGEPAAGEAYYHLAEIYRHRGDFQQAEEFYFEANKWGKKPQPGMALLRMSQKEMNLAFNSIKNVLEEAKNPIQRIKILPAYIKIMLAQDQITEARVAADELDTITKEFDALFLKAQSAYCQGTVLLKENQRDAAIISLRTALNFWNELNVPYEIATTRLLLGLAYRDEGDMDNAKMELQAAHWIFKELEALPDLRIVENFLGQNQEPDLHGLTLRELQVLNLVSDGEKNKVIANQLFISERTVERHLSNIFNKLQVNSRTEATSFAFKHRIL